MMITLRAHHLLCMQGFQGLGYSPAFVDNMALILEKIKQNPAIKCKIVTGCDDICFKCPHCKNNRCTKTENSETNIKKFDAEVLKLINLEPGIVLLVKEVFEKTSNITTPSDCLTCGWQKDCLWFHRFCE
jgi:uncharacterized protein